MSPELAGNRLWMLRRAWAGAVLCRDRHAAMVDAAPTLNVGASLPIKNLVGIDFHDLDYYAWEAVRICNIAWKVQGGGLHRVGILGRLEALDRVAPHLRSFRDSATHPEDNRDNDDVIYAGAVMRWGPTPTYLLDVRTAHRPLGEVVAATEAALVSVTPDEGPPARYDNGPAVS
jgi:hypothetical protein